MYPIFTLSVRVVIGGFEGPGSARMAQASLSSNTQLVSCETQRLIQGRLTGATTNALLLESSRVARAQVQDLLAMVGLELASLDDVEAALAHPPPDCGLVLVATWLPEHDACQLLEQLRLHAVYQSLPLIAIVSHGTLEESVRALDAGADDCLFKPLRSESFLSTVYRVLTAYRHVDEAPKEPQASTIDPQPYMELFAELEQAVERQLEGAKRRNQQLVQQHVEDLMQPLLEQVLAYLNQSNANRHTREFREVLPVFRSVLHTLQQLGKVRLPEFERGEISQQITKFHRSLNDLASHQLQPHLPVRQGIDSRTTSSRVLSSS